MPGFVLAAHSWDRSWHRWPLRELTANLTRIHGGVGAAERGPTPSRFALRIFLGSLSPRRRHRRHEASSGSAAVEGEHKATRSTHLGRLCLAVRSRACSRPSSCASAARGLHAVLPGWARTHRSRPPRGQSLRVQETRPARGYGLRHGRASAVGLCLGRSRDAAGRAPSAHVRGSLAWRRAHLVFGFLHGQGPLEVRKLVDAGDPRPHGAPQPSARPQLRGRAEGLSRGELVVDEGPRQAGVGAPNRGVRALAESRRPVQPRVSFLVGGRYVRVERSPPSFVVTRGAPPVTFFRFFCRLGLGRPGWSVLHGAP